MKFLLFLLLALCGIAFAQPAPQPSVARINGNAFNLTVNSNPIVTQSVANIVVTSGSINLSTSQLYNNILSVSGTLTANATLVFPANYPGSWTIINNTTGGYSLQLQVLGQSGTLTVPNAPTAIVNNGTTISLTSKPVTSITIPVTGGSITLTSAQLQNSIIAFSGTLTSAETIYLPVGSIGTWSFVNNTTGSYLTSFGTVGQATLLPLPQTGTRTISSDGVTTYSPLSQSLGLTTPISTAISDLPTYASVNGQSLNDSGYFIGTSGHALAALDGANTWTGQQTFNGGTNLAAGSVGSMLINGDMDIDQQFEGQSNGVGIDRWYYSYTASNGMALQRITGNAVSGYGHYLRITAPSSAVTVAATDQRVLRQTVEGSQVSALQWPNANAEPATLSFWAEASVAGTYAFSISNSTPNESYVQTYTIASANVWQQFTFTIPAPPIGSAWSTFAAGYYALAVRFDLGSGSTFAAPAVGTWEAANYLTAATATELVANSSATLSFTAVHLFAGSNAGQYIPRPYSDELLLAKRYYAKTFNEGVQPANNAGLGGALCANAITSETSIYWQIPAGMYAGVGSTPAVITFNPSNTNANWRDITAGADVTAAIDPISAKGGTGVQLITSGSTVLIGDELCIHATYDSHFR